MGAADDKPITPAHAWQPLTPRGVAAFAYATFARLFLVQLFVALLVSSGVTWFVAGQWFPVMSEAIQSVPSETVIQNGALITGAAGATRVAGNRSLEIIIDPKSAGGASGGSDVQLVLADREWRICGLFGCAAWPYPPGYALSLRQTDVVPWWGAWHRPMLAAVFVGILAVIMLLSWSLALVLAPAVKYIAFFGDRVISLAGSWRVACAAFLPGLILLAGGVILYALGALDLLRLGLVFLVHLVCAVFFVISSPLFLGRLGAPRRKNPFGDAPTPPSRGKTGSQNPFRQR